MEIFGLLALAVIPPFLAMLASHWFPWRFVIGRNLRPIETYIYGVLWIVAVPLLVMLLHGAWLYALLLAGGVAGAGVATLLAYAIDHTARARHAMLDAQDEAAHAEKWRVNQDTASD